jgi:hypothetical protein
MEVLIVRFLEPRVLGKGPIELGCRVVDWRAQDRIGLDAGE